MSLSEPLLQQFAREMQPTRTMLERVPQAPLTWKPHEKSMTLGRLATHIAEIPMWGINKSLNVIVSAAIVSYHVMKSLGQAART